MNKSAKLLVIFNLLVGLFASVNAASAAGDTASSNTVHLVGINGFSVFLTARLPGNGAASMIDV